MLPKSWQLPVFAGGFLASIAGLCLFPVGAWWLLVAGSLLLAMARHTRWATIVALALIVAALRFTHADQAIARKTVIIGTTQTVQALVLRVERPDERRQRLLLSVDGVSIRRTQADVPAYPSYQEGETLAIDCTWESFADEARMLRNRYAKGLYARCKPSEVQRITTTIDCRQHPLLCGRQWILASVAALWPRPTRSLVLGLLLGDKADFPKETLQQFSRAGISHIIALSGFNITVIIVSLEAVALRLALRKKQRAVFVAATIALFTIFVGGASSIVRAAFMGALALVGKTMGRKPSAARLLLVSALIMTLVNPYTLLYDVGFQLSCLATYGLLSFSEWFEAKLKWLPQTMSLRGSLATTLAASLPTLPLLAYTFGSLSVISPLTNILVLPLIPHIMWTSATAVLVSQVSASLAQVMASGVAKACAYILATSAWAASQTFAATEVTVSAATFVVTTAAIMAWGWYIQRQSYA